MSRELGEKLVHWGRKGAEISIGVTLSLSAASSAFTIALRIFVSGHSSHDQKHRASSGGRVLILAYSAFKFLIQVSTSLVLTYVYYIILGMYNFATPEKENISLFVRIYNYIVGFCGLNKK